MSGSKGQSANELLVIYMFVMLIFTIFVAGFDQQRSVDMQQAKVALADSIGEQFAYEINLAATSGNGYSRRVTYPLLLNGVTPYSIVFNNISDSIDVLFSMGTINYSHSFPIVTANVKAQPGLPASLSNGMAYGYILYASNQSFSTGQIYIQNINGLVVINLALPSSPKPDSVILNVTGTYDNGAGVQFFNITATVSDEFGNPAADGTLVNFQTNSGMIDSFVPTLKGNATAVLITSGVSTVNVCVSGACSSIGVNGH